jgi:hypothetical protein
MLDGETMQHEFEDEFEDEFESEYSNEFEDEYENEEFLGSIAKGVGNMLAGDGESEYENEYESEAFLGKLRRLIPKITPILKKIAPYAAGAVGTAIGGPAAGAALGAITSKLARESEFESELTSEFENEYEWTGEMTGEYEYESVPQYEALTEALATAASKVESEAEAEGYAGAFTARIIPIQSPAMRQITPSLIRGSVYLTRTLRKSPTTRPFVKVIPSIVDRTSKTLAKQAAKGQPITPRMAARVMAGHTQKVLSSPVTVAKTLIGSPKPGRKMKKPVPAKRSMGN